MTPHISSAGTVIATKTAPLTVCRVKTRAFVFMSGEEGKVFGEYSIQHVVNFSSVTLLMLLMCPRTRLSRISRYVDR